MGWDLYTLASTTAEAADLEATIASASIRTVGIVALAVIALILFTSRLKKPKNKVKKTIFLSIVSLVMAATIFLFSTTIYLNTVSDSGGPVHWHTDIEFWVCGTEVELRNPQGFLSNKIGTSTFHEHNDKRIHLEGVVLDIDYDASLDKFMKVVGGSVNSTGMVLPVEKGLIETETDGDISLNDVSLFDKYVREVDSGTVLDLKNGNSCGNDAAEVQAFVMKYDSQSKSYTQVKLAEPRKYVMRDESIVPPADCLIIEYAPTMTRTGKLCNQYGVRDITRCPEFTGGVSDPAICDIYEKRTTENTGGTPE